MAVIGAAHLLDVVLSQSFKKVAGFIPSEHKHTENFNTLNTLRMKLSDKYIRM